MNTADNHSLVHIGPHGCPVGPQKVQRLLKYFLKGEKINEENILLNIREITQETWYQASCRSTQRQHKNDIHQFKQARRWLTRQAVSHAGTERSERKSRRAGSRSETVRGLIFGMDDQRMTSPPPGSPPSSLHYSPLLSEVNSWSSCERTSHTNTFIPSLTRGHTFLSSDVVFLSGPPPVGVHGEFFSTTVWGFSGMWWTKKMKGAAGTHIRDKWACLCNSWNHRKI